MLFAGWEVRIAKNCDRWHWKKHKNTTEKPSKTKIYKKLPKKMRFLLWQSQPLFTQVYR